MNLTETTSTILDQALQAFRESTGLSFEKRGPSEVFPEATSVCLEPTRYGIEYGVEQKRWMQQTKMGAILTRLNRHSSRVLLVADYVNPEMADRLREVGAQFIDTAGNVYLSDKTLYVFVKGNRLPSGYLAPRRTTRAFNVSGLRVIFSLLLYPGLVGSAYRKIADMSGVSLGTIGWVLTDLKERGYVAELGVNRARVLSNPLELLNRWVEAYPEKLLPDIELGSFQASSRFPWRDIEPTNYGGCWGGEVGASLLDNYLQPAQGSLYLPKERLKEFLIDHKLKKSHETPIGDSGAIHIQQKFWRDPFEEQAQSISERSVAPVILVYADLLASADTRNLEAAKRLYDRIKTRLKVD